MVLLDGVDSQLNFSGQGAPLLPFDHCRSKRGADCSPEKVKAEAIFQKNIIAKNTVERR